MLLSEINVAYYQQLMQGIRDAIANGTLEDFRKQTRADWARGDIARGERLEGQLHANGLPECLVPKP